LGPFGYTVIPEASVPHVRQGIDARSEISFVNSVQSRSIRSVFEFTNMNEQRATNFHDQRIITPWMTLAVGSRATVLCARPVTDDKSQRFLFSTRTNGGATMILV
jgi:hypothetical protein